MERMIYRSYIIVILSMISLGLVGQWIIQRALSEVENDGNLINLAGRQRMISQMIVKEMAFQMLDSNHSDEILDSIQLRFKEVHRALKTGDKSLGLRPLDESTLSSEYAKMDADFLALNARLNRDTGQQNTKFLNELQEIQSHYLISTDTFVLKASEAIGDKLKRFQMLEAIVATVTFALILLELFLVFLPIFKRIRNQNETLKAISFGYSHIIRRPLANILSLTWLLKANIKTDFDQMKQLDLIEKEANEIDEIIRKEVRKAEKL